MMNLQVDPETCCKLPRPYYHPEFESQCLNECSQHKKRVRCCIRRCRAEKLGIYVNGTFSKDALKEFLTGSNETKRSEDWKEAVDKAVDFCEEKCE